MLYLALVVVGTTVPKQRLFISATFWWLLAQLKVVFFLAAMVYFGAVDGYYYSADTKVVH